MLKAFDRVVIQIHVGDVDLIEIQTFGIHSEPVVLSRDLNLIARHVQNGMIAAVVSEFQFVGPATQSDSENLVAQANSEYRLLPKQMPNILDGVFHGLRIAGTI